MAKALSQDVIRKRYIQWVLLPIMVLTIALGWKYPLWGYTVAVAMTAGMIGGAFRGRYVCGNLCPRGAFLDRVLSKISYSRPIPPFFRSMKFRWAVFAALMSFMTFQMINKSADMNWVAHIGRVFWFMCAFTTSIAVILGVFIHQRTWCSFCPVGTVSNAEGRGKYQLNIGPSCKECGLCEKSCPMDLEIVKHKPDARMLDPDCLKCSECAGVCPKGALSFPR
ncbi:MAG: 4Fe-4S binding protein [Nitrospirae bacterium]|nr:MAG: 4Fe-4S binding protein [Nitrospirota bacterium]